MDLCSTLRRVTDAPPGPASRLGATDTPDADALARRFVDRPSTPGRRAARVSPAALLVLALATLVHAVTLAVLATGAWALGRGEGWPLKTAGVLLVALAVVLRPRLGRAAKGRGLLDAERYPETDALLREVAAVARTRVPDRLQIGTELNASATTVGLRRRVVEVGAPLWVALSPQGRVALLAHEIGHFSGGDLRQLRYVNAAYTALEAWIDVFTPGHAVDMSAATWRGVSPNSQLWSVATWPVRALLVGYVRLIDLCAAASGRRQEHDADLLSVAVAGTDGAVELLESTLAITGLETTLNRTAVSPGRPPLAPAVVAYMERYDARARAAARRRGEGDRSSVDDTHPPTTERLRLVESVPRTSAAVVLDRARAARIEREWGPTVERMLTRLADSYR